MANKLRFASGSTRAVPSPLALPKANGATTAELTTATGWNTTTDVDFALYRRQLNNTTGKYEKIDGTQTEWTGKLTGTTLSAMELRAGTEPASGYPADGNSIAYCTATSAWGDDLINTLRTFITDDGLTLKKAPVQTALGITGDVAGGWDILNAGTAPTVTSGYNKGNREFDLTFAGVDLTTILSPGMRLKVNRTGTVPTQCLDLERDNLQYASKTTPTGVTFIDDFTCESWVKLESYGGTVTEPRTIISRRDTNNGYGFRISANGRVEIYGIAAGVVDTASSYQSIPLAERVHVAASLDMSLGVATIFINGISVPLEYTNSAATALVQAGDLAVGRAGSATDPEYFDGELSDVRVWSTIRTQAQIRDNMHQYPTVTTGLVSWYKLSGDTADSSPNANNLVGSGGAVATASGNPYNLTELCVITKVRKVSADTVVTVRTPPGYGIPNMTISSPFYSTQASPFGFSDYLAQKARRLMMIPVNQVQNVASTTISPFNPVTGYPITVPDDCSSLKISIFTSNFAVAAPNTLVIKVSNGSITQNVNELVQANQTTSNGVLSVSTSVPVTPGEVMTINAGWLATGGTGSFSGGIGRQQPLVSIDCE